MRGKPERTARIGFRSRSGPAFVSGGFVVGPSGILVKQWPVRRDLDWKEISSITLREATFGARWNLEIQTAPRSYELDSDLHGFARGAALLLELAEERGIMVRWPANRLSRKRWEAWQNRQRYLDEPAEIGAQSSPTRICLDCRILFDESSQWPAAETHRLAPLDALRVTSRPRSQICAPGTAPRPGTVEATEEPTRCPLTARSCIAHGIELVSRLDRDRVLSRFGQTRGFTIRLDDGRRLDVEAGTLGLLAPAARAVPLDHRHTAALNVLLRGTYGLPARLLSDPCAHALMPGDRVEVLTALDESARGPTPFRDPDPGRATLAAPLVLRVTATDSR